MKDPLIKFLVLQAILYDRQDNLDAALHCLQASLTLAEPEGYVRVYLDEGPVIAQLLHMTVRRTSASGYVKRLLAAFS